VSAARATSGKIHVSFVNVDPNRSATVSAKITGATARSISGRILTAQTLDAHNTFDQPDSVKPVPFKGTRKGDELKLEIPPKSVVVVAVE